MKLYIVRHGESFRNIKEGLDIIEPEVELTFDGKQQVKDTGRYLAKQIPKEDFIKTMFFSSPYKRTMQTSKIISEYLCNMKIILSPEIAEQQWGLYDGKSKSEIEAFDKIGYDYMIKMKSTPLGQFFYRYQNGESQADMYYRISLFFQKVLLTGAKNVIIVTHGIASNIMLMWLLNESPEWCIENEMLQNSKIIEFDTETKTLKKINPHLKVWPQCNYKETGIIIHEQNKIKYKIVFQNVEIQSDYDEINLYRIYQDFLDHPKKISEMIDGIKKKKNGNLDNNQKPIWQHDIEWVEEDRFIAAYLCNFENVIMIGILNK